MENSWTKLCTYKNLLERDLQAAENNNNLKTSEINFKKCPQTFL